MSAEEGKQTLFIKSEYAEPDQEKLLSFAESTVLGSIITSTSDSGIQVNQIPFTFHGNGADKTIQCHFPRENENQLQAILDHPENQIVIVFNGANHYISPNWFPTKKITHRFVPTWNYATVNITVKVKNHTKSDSNFLKSADEEQTTPNQQHRTFLQSHLTQLSNYCEELVGEEKPWALHEAPASFLDVLYTQLVGIEFEILKIEGKIKSAQNKPTEVDGIVAGLDNLVQNPHKYSNQTNASGQCPLMVRDLAKNNGLEVKSSDNSGITQNTPNSGNGKSCPVTKANCSSSSSCPFSFLTNTSFLYAVIGVLSGILLTSNIKSD